MWTVEKILSLTKGEGDCLLWTRCVNSDGYPRLGLMGNSNIKVHRLLFLLVYGFVPEVVRHACDNIRCLNPNHLLAGTPKQNAQDRHERKRTAGYVSSEEVEVVEALKRQSLTYNQIADQLKINPKRAEYIHLRYGG